MTTRAVIAQDRHGPIRIAVECHGLALQVLTKAERNRAVREALVAGGQLWLRVFAPLRFTPYARRLGYYLPKPEPFVRKGEMRDSVLGSSSVAAVARGGASEIRIKVPYGHPLNARHADIFKTVPSWEVQRVADEVGAWLLGITRMIGSARGKGGKVRFRRLAGPVQPIRPMPGTHQRPAAATSRRVA